MQPIGFRRNIYLAWLEQVATMRSLGEAAPAIRAKMDETLAPHIVNNDNRRQTIDILINIWARSGDGNDPLRQRALALFQATTAVDDHVCLHYGLTLLAYPFFRLGAYLIGQQLRFGGATRLSALQERMLAQMGAMGAVAAACKRILFSLRDWGLLVPAQQPYTYRAREPRLRPGEPELVQWLLAAVLAAHPSHDLPLADLLALPELFGFDLPVQPADLRGSDLLQVYSTPSGWRAGLRPS